MKPNLYLVEGGANPLVDTWKSNPSTETRHGRIQDIHTWHRRKLFKGPSKNPLVEQQTYADGTSAAEARIDGVWLHQQYEYNSQWKVCFVCGTCGMGAIKCKELLTVIDSECESDNSPDYFPNVNT